MAAKKRRSRGLRGLGGTPKSHAQWAKLGFDAVVTTTGIQAGKGYDAAMASGSCVKAFNALLQKESEYSRAHLHLEEYEKSKSVDPRSLEALSKRENAALTALWKYRDEFKPKCLVGGGLSGTPRRRRRR